MLLSGFAAAVTFGYAHIAHALPHLHSSDIFARSNASSACQQIQATISSASAFNFPALLGLNPTYDSDIAHWAISSTQHSECTVEPGTPADVGAVLNIIGTTRSPFGVKGENVCMFRFVPNLTCIMKAGVTP